MKCWRLICCGQCGNWWKEVFGPTGLNQTRSSGVGSSELTISCFTFFIRVRYVTLGLGPRA